MFSYLNQVHDAFRYERFGHLDTSDEESDHVDKDDSDEDVNYQTIPVVYGQ